LSSDNRETGCPPGYWLCGDYWRECRYDRPESPWYTSRPYSSPEGKATSDNLWTQCGKSTPAAKVVTTVEDDGAADDVAVHVDLTIPSDATATPQQLIVGRVDNGAHSAIATIANASISTTERVSTRLKRGTTTRYVLSMGDGSCRAWADAKAGGAK
jgi:hypothetical protein